MPLQDHFRPPLGLRGHWQAFQNAWATEIASDLNARLPEGYFAEPKVHFGIDIDIDVAAVEESASPSGIEAGWAPPNPSMTIPFPIVTDSVEVSVFHAVGGPVLAGAIALVSPADKDRPAHRIAFVSKCETYLQGGLGVVVVDVVTNRGGDLHAELVARLLADEAPRIAGGDALYSAAYRPVERQGEISLDIWREPLALGDPLTVLPLWLRGGLCLPVNLEATYERTRREHRIADA